MPSDGLTADEAKANLLEAFALHRDDEAREPMLNARVHEAGGVSTATTSCHAIFGHDSYIH